MLDFLKDILGYQLFDHQGYKITLSAILKILILFACTKMLLRSLRSNLTRKVFEKNRIDNGRKQAVLQIVKYLVYILFIVLALRTAHVDISIFLAGSAALLVGIGLGVQHIFNDLISGIIMLFEGNVDVGDKVEVGGLLGIVQRVGMRTSKVMTRDSISIIVPNSRFIQDNVVNWTHRSGQVTRFRVNVGVAYGSDVQLVKGILLGCAKGHIKIEKGPAPFVRFVDFGDSSLDFELLFWSREIWQVEDVKSDLRFAIDMAFRENGVTIPFPQRDLHIKSGQFNLPKKVTSKNSTDI